MCIGDAVLFAVETRQSVRGGGERMEVGIKKK